MGEDIGRRPELNKSAFVQDSDAVRHCECLVPIMSDMTYIPGSHSAALLLQRGLDADAVIRGLVDVIGMDAEQARRATTNAAGCIYKDGGRSSN